MQLLPIMIINRTRRPLLIFVAAQRQKIHPPTIINSHPKQSYQKGGKIIQDQTSVVTSNAVVVHKILTNHYHHLTIGNSYDTLIQQ